MLNRGKSNGSFRLLWYDFDRRKPDFRLALPKLFTVCPRLFLLEILLLLFSFFLFLLLARCLFAMPALLFLTGFALCFLALSALFFTPSALFFLAGFALCILAGFALCFLTLSALFRPLRRFIVHATLYFFDDNSFGATVTKAGADDTCFGPRFQR